MNEGDPIMFSLGPVGFEDAIKWFKNFRSKNDNSRDLKENIPDIGIENVASKVWDIMHYTSDYSHLTDINYWKEEMNKCLNSEEYYYNNYCLINGRKPEPVPEDYFKNLRIFKSRRFPSRYLPADNTFENVQEKVFAKYLNFIQVELKYRNNGT